MAILLRLIASSDWKQFDPPRSDLFNSRPPRQSYQKKLSRWALSAFTERRPEQLLHTFRSVAGRARRGAKAREIW